MNISCMAGSMQVISHVMPVGVIVQFILVIMHDIGIMLFMGVIPFIGIIPPIGIIPLNPGIIIGIMVIAGVIAKSPSALGNGLSVSKSPIAGLLICFSDLKL